MLAPAGSGAVSNSGVKKKRKRKWGLSGIYFAGALAGGGGWGEAIVAGSAARLFSRVIAAIAAQRRHRLNEAAWENRIWERFGGRRCFVVFLEDCN